MGDERRPLDYAPPRRPEPRKLGAWGTIAVCAVVVAAFTILIMLVLLFDRFIYQ